VTLKTISLDTKKSLPCNLVTSTHQSIAPFYTAIQQLRTHFVLLQAVRREDEQSELHQLQNARRRTRAQNKRNPAPSPQETPKNAALFNPGCAI
jgi:hypothetical protein